MFYTKGYLNKHLNYLYLKSTILGIFEIKQNRMGRAVKIILQPITFRKMDHVAILCPDNSSVDEIIREMEDAEWSTGYHFWHLPIKDNTIQNLSEALKGVATIDKSAFHNFKPNQVAESTVKSRSYKIPKPNSEQLELINGFCNFCSEKGYSDGTIKVYRSLLGVFLGYFHEKHPLEITQNDVDHFMKNHIDKNRLSPNYKRLMQNTLRRFFDHIDIK